MLSRERASRRPRAVDSSQPDSETEVVPRSATSDAVLRILVVDDYVDGAEMLTEILQANGHEVRMAHDAASALEIVTGFSPQVACLDIAMPVVDGYQLAVQLRAIPGLEDIRLIAVSGFGREQDRQKSREAGFAIHLVKPIDLAAVEAAIHGRSIG